MACILTTGFTEECDDSLGGIEAGEFLVTQKESITAFTVTAGEVTAITQAGGSSFFRYFMKKEMADALTTSTKDPQTGTNVFETVVNAMIQKLSNVKNTELKLLAGKPVVVIYKDQNGIFHTAGMSLGAELLTHTAGTGKELNTQNGYVLTFTSREGDHPFTVDATVVAGLVIA